MAKYDQGGGCPCGLYKECDPKCEHYTPPMTDLPIPEIKPIVKPDNGGLRYSEGKPRYDLIPPDMLEDLAIHYQQGAKKYADRNWERGMSWCECFRALMSHSWKWFRGDRYDVEDPKMPGYRAPHSIAMVWNAIALYTYEKRQIGIDDRPILDRKE